MAQLDRDIAQLEKDWQVGGETVKADWQAKRDALTARRKKVVGSIKTGTDQQKKRYETWLDKQRHKFEEWKHSVDTDRDHKKRERLEKRIADQETKLAALNEEVHAI